MELRFVTMRAHNLSSMVEFYGSVLGLPLLASGVGFAVFRVGLTTLMFEEAGESEPFYHFAIDVPQNQLEEAAAWLDGRATLLDHKGDTRVQFVDWNATSVYFHDPAGNIVELIARHNLSNASELPFSSASLLSVSEVGWPYLDLESDGAVFDELPTWRDYGKMKVMGAETGLILLAPVGRGWLPTGRPAEIHPCSVVMADELGRCSHVVRS